jgi:transposase
LAARARGDDKGKVEGLVKYTHRTFMTPLPHAASFAALNAALMERVARATANTPPIMLRRSANGWCAT